MGRDRSRDQHAARDGLSPVRRPRASRDRPGNPFPEGNQPGHQPRRGRGHLCLPDRRRPMVGALRQPPRRPVRHRSAPIRPRPQHPEPVRPPVLRVRIGQRDDVSPHAAQVQLADGRPWRARVANEIINLLFEDGQTPTRRAVEDLYYATSGNPRIDPAFQQTVNRAADAMGTTSSDTALFQAVQAVINTAPGDRHLSGPAGPALRRLKAGLDEYQRWTQAGQTP